MIASEDEPDDLLYWQVQILFILLFTGLGLGFFILIASLVIAYTKNMPGMAIVDTAAFMGGLYVLFSRGLKYKNRAIICSLFLYFIGSSALIHVGFLSSGPEWLFSFAIFAGVLIGPLAAFLAILLNIFTLGAIGWMTHIGFLGHTLPFYHELLPAVVAGINFIMLNALIAISVSMLLKGLASTNQKMANLMSSLEKERDNLFKTNKTLEKEIEARKQLFEDLRQSETKHGHIIESIEEGYYEADLDGQAFVLNSAGCRMLGYKRDEILGMNTLDFMDRENAKNIYKTCVKIYETGEPVKAFDLEFIKKDNTRCNVELSIYLIKDTTGHPIGFRGICRDVTEKRENEAALLMAKQAAEMASQAKSEFLANMSHELRTPLNHIIGFTELIVDKQFGELNSIQEDYLSDVLISSKHLLSLINDILDLSKVEAGRLEFEPSVVDLGGLLESSLIMIKEKTMNQGIKLIKDFNNIPETIQADERKLKQIMYNLLSNAAKFTPDGGEIILTAQMLKGSNLKIDNSSIGFRFSDIPIEPVANYIRICVKDTGIGLEPHDLERIFNSFEQVDSTMNRKYQGTGLGLALTRQLVELHNGYIWAESEGKGRGSSFCFIILFYLPEHLVQDFKRGEYEQ